MSSKTAGRVISFRVPEEMAQAVDRAASESGMARSAWLVEVIMSGLGRQRESVTPETRMQQLIGKMEAIMTGTLPRSLSQAVSMDSEVSAGITAKEVIAEMVENARRAGKQSSNKRIVARLNELHISPARGSEWTTSMVDNLKRRMDTGNS